MMLARKGHQVSGYSLKPEPKSMFELAKVKQDLVNHTLGDIRDHERLYNSIQKTSPDYVVHMAAQPLVREGYRNPRETFEVNVMGTLNVLEAAKDASSVQGILNVTTDKVYKEDVNKLPYSESTSLGGIDPYSASKSMADILATAMAKSFSGPAIVNARAGNVIGGGDYSIERLIPDLMASFSEGVPAIIRFPNSVRPWQHVLDCLSGYEQLLFKMTNEHEISGISWNFGPNSNSMKTVAELTQYASELWGEGARWQSKLSDEHFHEAALLTLDSTKSRAELDWSEKLDYPRSIEWTVDWYKKVYQGVDPRNVTLNQIDRFIEDQTL